jgi:hypothetical protein
MDFVAKALEQHLDGFLILKSGVVRTDGNFHTLEPKSRITTIRCFYQSSLSHALNGTLDRNINRVMFLP